MDPPLKSKALRKSNSMWALENQRSGSAHVRDMPNINGHHGKFKPLVSWLGPG